MNDDAEKVFRYNIARDDEAGACDHCGKALAVGDRAVIRGRARYCGIQCMCLAMTEEPDEPFQLPQAPPLPQVDPPEDPDGAPQPVKERPIPGGTDDGAGR